MSDRESMLLARLLTEENRSKAAEARVAELETALRWYGDVDTILAADAQRRTALQREPSDKPDWDRLMKESEACAPIPPEELPDG